MQIQTTKISRPLATSAPANAPVAGQNQEAPAPKDSFASVVGREAFGEARHLGNRAANVVGGAGAVIGASIGASAALAGGAIVGMAAGGAVAMPIAQLFSSGGFDFIKTGLSSVGVGGQIGIGLALVTLTVGGGVVGDKIAGLAAKPLGYGTGLATGAVKGTLRYMGQEAGALPPVKREEKPETQPIVSKKSPLMANIQRGFGGVGALTGLTGGATLGLAIGAGTEIVSGLFKGDLGMAAVTTAGLWGAGIGGGAGAIVGGIGGMKVADMIHSGFNGIAETSRISQKLLEQDKRGNLMDELRDRLQTNEADFNKEKQAGDSNVAARETALNQRSESLTKQQQTLNDKLTNESGITQARSNELYTNKTNEFAAFEGRLDADKTHLDSEKVRLTGKEGNIDNLIRQEATQRRETHRNAEQGKYDTRKGGLESREKALQTKETKINDIAHDQVQKELNPLRQEASAARSQAASNRSEASNQRSEASRLEGQIGGILAEAQRYDSQANSQESQNSSLRSEESSLSSRENSLESDLRSCQADKQRKADEERRRKEEERRRDDSRHGGGGNNGGGGHRDDSRHGGGSGGHRDGSKWG